SRGAPRGDDPSRRNNADRIPSPIHFSNSHSRSRGAFLRPGFATLASPTRIEGWAERRETFGCSGTRGAYHDAIRQALARRLASHNAGRSPLGAPPWRFFTRGRPSVPGMTRIRAASPSQPGHSAWRATSRASRGKRLQATAAGRHAPLRLQDRLRRRPSMSEADEAYRSTSYRSQEIIS